MFQESKTRQNFRKTNNSFPQIGTRTCAYQEVRNVCFSEFWRALLSLNTRFEIRLFPLLPTSCPELFCKEGILKSFAKFTGKHLCQNLFLIKLQTEGLLLYGQYFSIPDETRLMYNYIPAICNVHEIKRSNFSQ